MRNNLYICNANPQTKTTLTLHISGSNFGTHYNGYAQIKDIKSEKGKQLTQIKANRNKPRSFSIQLDTRVKDIMEVCFM